MWTTQPKDSAYATAASISLLGWRGLAIAPAPKYAAVNKCQQVRFLIKCNFTFCGGLLSIPLVWLASCWPPSPVTCLSKRQGGRTDAPFLKRALALLGGAC